MQASFFIALFKVVILGSTSVCQGVYFVVVIVVLSLFYSTLQHLSYLDGSFLFCFSISLHLCG